MGAMEKLKIKINKLDSIAIREIRIETIMVINKLMYKARHADSEIGRSMLITEAEAHEEVMDECSRVMAIKSLQEDTQTAGMNALKKDLGIK